MAQVTLQHVRKVYAGGYEAVKGIDLENHTNKYERVSVAAGRPAARRVPAPDIACLEPYQRRPLHC